MYLIWLIDKKKWHLLINSIGSSVHEANNIYIYVAVIYQVGKEV